MKSISFGHRLFLTVVSLFLVFAVLFIVFQQTREKEFKIEKLNLRLQDYNVRMYDALHLYIGHDEKSLSGYVKEHNVKNLRVTLIRPDGTVFFDNERKDYADIRNHSDRDEVKLALLHGSGYDINRSSSTMNRNFFYSATYFPKDSFIIRSALPYNNDLVQSLAADQHYIWFTLIVTLILVVVLYRFMQHLGTNITNLRRFAKRADRNEPLELEDLAEFPNDELGEISEHIIKLYRQLQKTKGEQTVLKRQLTQNIAHELKTPVASIQGYLETILENPNITEEQKQMFLQRCFAQSQRLTSLLHDISTLNRLDDGVGMLAMAPVDVSATVDLIVKELALQLSDNGMTVKNELPEHLVINGNQSMVYSIFRNLMDNAIAYSGHGTTVTIRCDMTSPDIRFSFSDNGIGVGSEHLERLFERFYRVDKGRSRKLGGTGLGLAIVKNAVIVHGGAIQAKHNPGGGLLFEFTMKQ
jgi:signal transduction histidine kinase